MVRMRPIPWFHKAFGAIIAAAILAGCEGMAFPAQRAAVTSDGAAAQSGRSETHENLHGVLWIQTAAEYRVLAETTYAQARAALDKALADPSWTAELTQSGVYDSLPPAVIMDLDETVLDNSKLLGQLVLTGAPSSSGLWRDWVRRAEAGAVPGAVSFVRYAESKRVTVFYVSNRDAEVEEPTRRNLKTLGVTLPKAVDTVLLADEQPKWSGDKTSRRAHVARDYRVLLMLGDDLNDFVSGANAGPEERRSLARRHTQMWGERWFLLPNPVYGSWERALRGDDDGLSGAEILTRKRNLVKTYR